MTERDIIRALVHIIENRGVRALREFARRHADRLGVPLPETWIPTAERDEMEKAADEGGWPR